MEFRSRIIRRSGVALQDKPREVESYDFAQLHSGDLAVAQANDKAAHILNEAQIAHQAALEQARQQGYAEGFAAADQECADLVKVAQTIAERVALEREELLEQSEGEIVQLALEIAHKLVGAAVQADPELVVEVCRGAMRKAFQRETLTVLANPDDLEMLRTAGPQMADAMGGIEKLDFVAERRLPRGNVIVRTPAGEIDATFASKADKIEQGLLEVLEARRAESRRSA